MPSISDWAQTLDEGRLNARELGRITETWPELSPTDAYQIQAAGIALRMKRGEKVIGYKMGLTSEAKRRQMGLHSPCYGVLTDAMQVPMRDGIGQFRLAGSIHPKIEPEIAFWVGRELRGEITEAQAIAACTGVSAALEILDSRFIGFKYFSLPDVIADNSSSAWFAVGPERRDFQNLDLGALAMRMSVNGQVAQTAQSSEISGHPARSLVELCRLLATTGQSLPAGSLVLAGAATAAVPLEKRMSIRLEIEGLASLEVTTD